MDGSWVKLKAESGTQSELCEAWFLQLTTPSRCYPQLGEPAIIGTDSRGPAAAETPSRIVQTLIIALLFDQQIIFINWVG